MKLLFDQNLSFKLVRKLADVFPESSQAKLLGFDQATDSDLWEYARQNGFTLVTQDSDYNDRSALLGHPPKVLWLRCGNRPTDYVERLIRSHVDEIQRFGQDTSTGCIEIY